MNQHISLGLFLVALGMLAVTLGLGSDNDLVLLLEAVGLLLEAGGLYLIVSGNRKKKQ